jgi:hypothetical protein
MVFPRARLVVSACLFLAWLVFLLYLVIQNEHMIVLSRPQFLAAPLCVIAEVGDREGHPEDQVIVVSVVWSHDKEDEKLDGKRILVRNLPNLGTAEHYLGAGKYILPLTPLGKNGSYEVVPSPRLVASKLLIYPLMAQTEAQLEVIARQRAQKRLAK